MHAILDRFASAATRRPRTVIVALIAVTLGLGVLASHNRVEVDLTRLGSDGSDTVQAMDRVRAEFGDPTAAVQVILDAGPDGDLLTGDGLALLATVERITLDALGDAARATGDSRHAVRSLRTALDEGPSERGTEPTLAEDEAIGRAIAGMIAANPQLAALVSDDLDPTAGTARATVALVPLEPGLTAAERTDAGERVRAAFAAASEQLPQDVTVTVYSAGLFTSGLLDAIRAEVPLLFALALLVVLAILALTYRSAFDVAIGAAGLLATVACTFGLVALLGPAFLEVTGPLTQLVVIVPVLLVGLGVDYSVHLTSRYREERASGASPERSATRAMGTVGSALVLATVATAAGFASIAAAPLGMLADLGVFVAIGVVCAFVIMGLLVPAARVWRDRGRRRGAGVTRELGLARLMRGPIALSQRAPWAGIVAAAILTTISLVAATGLRVEFDRDDFVPDGSDVAATLDHQREVFGGGVTESTFVVVDGDLTDPAVAGAMLAAQQDVGEIEGVRSLDGSPQVASVMTLAAAVTELAPGGVPSGVDLAELYAELRAALGTERLDPLLTPEATSALVQIRTTAGDAGAQRLGRAITAAFDPVVAAGADVTVTSEPLIIAEMSEELASFQIRSLALTLGVVLLLLVGFYGVVHRRPALGVIAMIPAALSASMVLGTMRLLDISFNVLTATLTAIAIGIGVPYGVHVVNRFAETQAGDDPGDPLSTTLRSVGGALAGSALTTLGAFVVLSFSGLPPIRSLGLLGGAGIGFALLAALLVEPGALALWARRRTA